MDPILNKLILETTIFHVTDSQYMTLYGVQKTSRFLSDQGNPITIEEIEPIWRSIFDKYGDVWNAERQLLRLLYDQLSLFITSFTYLRVHKVNIIENKKRDESSFRQFSTCLASMYIFGKKATDLICEIEQTKTKTAIQSKFSNTRNLIFEHNYAPKLLDKKYIVDPSFFGASGTTSQLQISLHSNTKEAVGYAFVDFYEDYYQLEEELINWLKSR